MILAAWELDIKTDNHQPFFVVVVVVVVAAAVVVIILVVVCGLRCKRNMGEIFSSLPYLRKLYRADSCSAERSSF